MWLMRCSNQVKLAIILELVSSGVEAAFVARRGTARDSVSGWASFCKICEMAAGVIGAEGC